MRDLLSNKDRKIILLIQKRLLNWYNVNGRIFPWRNQSASKYQKVVAEVLLQRTLAETVAKFIPNFYRKYGSWNSISDESEAELQEYLRPLGLWRSRTHNLKNLAYEIVLRRGVYPKDKNILKSIPGVGDYIANSILLFCHNCCEPLFDVNMERLINRVFQQDLKMTNEKKLAEEMAKKFVNCKEPILLNWAIIDYSHIVCRRKNPLCKLCVISSSCQHFSNVKTF